MTNQHPITPPPELITDWCKQRACINEPGPIHVWLATEAARWGADQELEACCQWLKQEREEPGWANRINLHFLRSARRPKPPGLKEQALTAMLHLQKAAETSMDTIEAVHIICQALEALPND